MATSNELPVYQIKFISTILALLVLPQALASGTDSQWKKNLGWKSSCRSSPYHRSLSASFVTSNLQSSAQKKHRQYHQLPNEFDSFLFQKSIGRPNRCKSSVLIRMSSSDSNNMLDLNSLMEMDVVVYSRRKASGEADDQKELGAIQEDGSLAPISCWTLEDAYGGSGGSDAIEFLVAEEDRFELDPDQVVIQKLVDETMLGYGTRQVGGGKGPGNPHGEESEQLYYIDREFLEIEGIEPVIKPDLEILW